VSGPGVTAGRSRGAVRPALWAAVRPSGPLEAATRVITAGLLAGSGYIHLHLYLDGYRYIPTVGNLFLVQEAGSFAVALLLLVGGALVLRLAAAGLATGALVGFVLSRTSGVAGFTERGWNPAPDALASVLVEVAVLLIVAAGLVPAALRLARRPARTVA
jgi:hypothetical protein